MIRFLDIIISTLLLLFLAPILLIIALIVALTSKGGAFYIQNRVGKNGKDFPLYKFRTMRPNASKGGLLTVGGRDARITAIGYYLRKFKIDELPQLANVFLGHMSMVGPRPEVRKYVEMYNSEQRKVLQVRPGITDIASIDFMNENELLAQSDEPEKLYIEEIMPKKLELNKEFVENPSLEKYFSIMFQTLIKILKK